MSVLLKNPLHPSVFPLPRSEWFPDDKHKKCMLCSTRFSGGVFRSGKHHCRKCGHVVCKKCCKMRIRKQMVCKQCYAKYHKYEFVFTPTMMVDNADIEEEEEEDDDDDDDEEYLEEEESSQSLLIFNESPIGYRQRSTSVTRKAPVIALDIDEDEDINEEEAEEGGNDDDDDDDIVLNRVDRESYGLNYISINLEGDMKHNKNAEIESLSLQNSIGLLKLYIEQLAIYTQRVRGLNDEEKLKEIEWTEDDVWKAIKQKERDENRYNDEFGVNINENNENENMNASINEDAAEEMKKMMNTKLSIGFEDIYESIVAYEYDIKSLCDMILIEIASNEALNEEIDSYKITNGNLRKEVNHLQCAYDEIVSDLHTKEYSLHAAREKENELMRILNECSVEPQIKHEAQIKKLKSKQNNNESKNKKDIIIVIKNVEKENKNLSLLTMEQCILFREEIGSMKKWIKQSKQSMRNLKTEFAQNYKYLELQLNKFADIWDEFYYEREVLFQKRKKLNKYIEDSAHKINTQEHEIKRKQFEIEENNKILCLKENELNERESCFKNEKKQFDAMCRKYNEEKIGNELKNAQILSKKMLDIETKERKVLSETDNLEITKQYLTKQKQLYLRERELLHQQQQIIYANKKSLAKQKSLISNDQSYIQQEYIDAKDRMENERYVLNDKINVLTTQTQTQVLDIESLKSQLNQKHDMYEKLQDKLLNVTKEMNQIKSIQFNQSQEINNLKHELQQSSKKNITFQQSLQSQHKRNIDIMQEIELVNAQKVSLKNAQKVSMLQIEQLKDELEMFKIKSKSVLSARKTSKPKSKKSKKSKSKKSKKLKSKIKTKTSK